MLARPPRKAAGAIRHRCRSHVARPVDVVYRFVVLDFFDNYPRWSPQVESLAQTTAGPMAVGITGHQVRVDYGRRTASEFRVGALVPCHYVTFEGLDHPYRITYAMAPADGGTDLVFEFELIELAGALRPFAGMIRRVIERTTAPVAGDIRDLIEAETEPPASA